MSLVPVKVVLWPSEVGAMLPDVQSAWMTRYKLIGKVWRRSSPNSYDGAFRRWCAAGQQLVVPSSVVEAVDAAGTKPKSRMARLMAQYSAMGRDNEARAASAIEKQGFCGALHRNVAVEWHSDASASAASASALLFGDVTRAEPYSFSGELDAVPGDVDADGKRGLFEFKLRCGPLAPQPPAGDIAQVATYLSMTGFAYGELWEHRHGSDGSDDRKTRIENDAAVWERDYQPHIEEFVCAVRRCMRGSLEDEALRQAVFSASERHHVPPPALAEITLDPELGPRAHADLGAMDFSFMAEADADAGAAAASPEPTAPAPAPAPAPASRRQQQRVLRAPRLFLNFGASDGDAADVTSAFAPTPTPTPTPTPPEHEPHTDAAGTMFSATSASFYPRGSGSGSVGSSTSHDSASSSSGGDESRSRGHAGPRKRTHRWRGKCRKTDADTDANALLGSASEKKARTRRQNTLMPAVLVRSSRR
jgi:hypothetical protein